MNDNTLSDSEILRISKKLIRYVESMENYNKSHSLSNHMQIKKKDDDYNKLSKHLFPLYRGIIDKVITEKDFHMLKNMFKEKTKYNKGNQSLKEASGNVSDMLQGKFKTNFTEKKD